MLAFGAILPVTLREAAAQSTATSYDVETTGDEVTWSDDWSLNEDSTGVGSTGELVYLVDSDTESIVQLLYFDPESDIEDTLDQLIDLAGGSADSVDIIDEDAGRNDGYILAEAHIGEVDIAVYARADAGDDALVATVLIAETSTLGDVLERAQDDIEVNGDGVFPDEDADDLQDLIDGAATDDDDATPTEEATAETDDDVVVNTDDDDKKLNDEDEDDTDRDVDADTTPAVDPSELGLVDEGEYESPQFGTEITWTDDWVLSPYDDEPIGSDEDSAIDSLVLTPAESDTPETYADLYIRIFEGTSSDTPESIEEYWTSDDYLASDSGEGLTILLQDSSRDEAGVVSYYTTDDGDDVFQYMTAYFLDDGTVVVLEFYASPDSIETVLASAQDSIEVEGDSVITLFDADDILDAYDEAS